MFKVEDEEAQVSQFAIIMTADAHTERTCTALRHFEHRVTESKKLFAIE
jgi:hypothetical protein